VLVLSGALQTPNRDIRVANADEWGKDNKEMWNVDSEFVDIQI